MPIYEYKCTECDERFDIEQSIHDEPLTALEGDEHEHALKKVFSPIGIAFKGSGFYKNDARGKKSSTTPSSSSASSKPATPSSSSSDSSTASSTPAASASTD